MPAGLIAGFDAGQSHTTCRLAWLDQSGQWREAGQGEGCGVSHLAAAAGEARFQEALRSSLAAARQAAGVGDGPLLAAAVGASGIEQGSRVQEQGQSLAATALQLPSERLQVCGDERTALHGAFAGGPGILVISGTGCIAVGKNRAGSSHRCGGWGWLLDGAGSAMDLGRDGLAMSVQMADGRVVETPLRAALWQALEARTAQELKALVVEPGFGAAGFARLAPLVNQLALEGDAPSREIVERSGLALAAMVQGVAAALQMPAASVCGVGGALRHLGALRQAFSHHLSERLPQAQLLEPLGDAQQGALTMAAALAVQAPDDA